MKKLLQFAAAALAFAFLFSIYGYGIPVNIQKDAGALTQSFTVPSGVTISATGTGTIAATTVTGFSPASGKVLTLSNSMTFTATDGSTIAFGAGGTVLYSGGAYVSSLTGTTNQITASASTGAVTLSLAGPHNFTSLTATAVLLGGGTSAVNASNLTYVTPTLTVPDLFNMTSAGSISFTAGGSNKNIFAQPSGTSSSFHLNFNATPLASMAVTNTDNALRIDGNDANGFNARIYLINYGANNSGMFFVSTRGTAASPTHVNSGDQLGTWGVRGWGSTSGIGGADFRVYATEDFSVSAGGSEFRIMTTTNGSTGVGNRLVVGNYGKLTHTPNNGSLAAWGTTGAVTSTSAATYTDSSSSGTVATAVAHSLAVPIFAASSATVFTDAANFYIAGDVSNGSNVTLTRSYGLWNVGKTRLGAPLHIYKNATVPATFSTSDAQTALRSVGVDATQNTVDVIAYNAYPVFAGSAAGGTAASPTVTTTDLGARIGMNGWTGSTWGFKAEIDLLASETWSSSANGTYITFLTTANTTTSRTEKMRILGSGAVLIADTTFDTSGGTAPLISINKNGSVPGAAQAASDAQTGLRIFGVAATQSGIINHGFQANSVFNGYNANGTAAAPTATTVASGALARFGGGGFDGTSYAINAEFVIMPGATWSGSTRESYAVIRTTPATSTTRSDTLTITGGTATTLTGGAGNMTVIAGTGNSRSITLQGTNSSGSAVNILSATGNGPVVLGVDGSSRTYLTINTNNTFPYYNFNQAAGSSGANTGAFVLMNNTSAFATTSNSIQMLSLTPLYNQASGTASNTDISGYRTQTAVGSGAQKGLDLGVGSTSWYAFSYGNAATTGAFNASSGTEVAVAWSPTFASQTSTAGWTAFKVNATDGSGSGAKLLQDLQLAGASKFSVTSAGAVTAASTITTLGGATFHTTSSALTDGAGVALGTLATAPAAGNPTKWIGINDNGTTRYVPAW